MLIRSARMARSNFHAHKDVRGVDGEDRLRDDRATHVHEGMEEIAEIRGGAFQGNDERIALQLLIRQIQQGDDAKTSVREYTSRMVQ